MPNTAICRTPHGVRGLKFALILTAAYCWRVAPLADAWIEIVSVSSTYSPSSGVPFAGCMD